ncbi:MAG: D-glycero-alpha-D-manno-heptose-1,7-bisphosphate 7-phosphatase [Kiritimatiellia bacterium]
MKKALFLDRDGTINADYAYVHDKEHFDFLPGVFDFCRAAEAKGYLIIVVTNQSGIARGYYTEADFRALNDWMVARFAEAGVTIADVFHCPELSGPDRKPEPGLFLKARDKYGLDMAASVSLGDKPRDVEAGARAGVGKNLLFTGTYPEDEL